MFKAGEEVICIEAYLDLVNGKNYIVTNAYTVGPIPYIEVLGVGGAFFANRFVAVPEYSAVDNIKEPTALEVQHGGGHYKGMKIQPVEFIHANNIGYMEGNAIKYLCRWQLKNGLEDLNKAKHYIELLIEMENARNE